MSYELSRHKRSDKVKWTATAVGFALLAVLIAGMCLQLFGKGKAKPSEWFKKADKKVETSIEDTPATGGEKGGTTARISFSL